jgi:hypothetical protein
MGLNIATGLSRWVESSEAKILHAGRLNIGPRLILGFVFIILAMLAADAIVLWQFHVVGTQAERLNDIDQKLVAVLRLHSSLAAFHDRLEEVAGSGDAGRLVKEAGPLRAAVLADIRRATSALSLLPSDLQRDPTVLPTLLTIQSALPSQLVPSPPWPLPATGGLCTSAWRTRSGHWNPLRPRWSRKWTTRSAKRGRKPC